MVKIEYIDEVDMWFNKMLDLVSRQSYTKKEIEKKLAAKKLDSGLISKVVAKLCEYRYIDDEAYAKRYVNDRINYRSKREIEYKLVQKGVPQRVVYAELLNTDSGAEAVRFVANKYMKNKELSKPNLQKLYAYLFGKGFESEDISAVVAEFRQKIKNE